MKLLRLLPFLFLTGCASADRLTVYHETPGSLEVVELTSGDSHVYLSRPDFARLQTAEGHATDRDFRRSIRAGDSGLLVRFETHDRLFDCDLDADRHSVEVGR